VLSIFTPFPLFLPRPARSLGEQGPAEEAFKTGNEGRVAQRAAGAGGLAEGVRLMLLYSFIEQLPPIARMARPCSLQ
jgi:hypothetical protein